MLRGLIVDSPVINLVLMERKPENHVLINDDVWDDGFSCCLRGCTVSLHV